MNWQYIGTIIWAPLGLIGWLTYYPFAPLLRDKHTTEVDKYGEAIASYVLGPLALPILATSRFMSLSNTISNERLQNKFNDQLLNVHDQLKNRIKSTQDIKIADALRVILNDISGILVNPNGKYGSATLFAIEKLGEQDELINHAVELINKHRKNHKI